MIRLGTLAGYFFEGPRLLGGWTPPERPGVYAILYLPDQENKPQEYAVIYVGQSENLAKEGFPFKHPRAHCWTQRSGSKWKVHICTLDVPGATASHREMIVQELAAIYDPHCNEQKYDKAWKDEWIGEYSAPTAGPLTARGPDDKRR